MSELQKIQNNVTNLNKNKKVNKTIEIDNIILTKIYERIELELS